MKTDYSSECEDCGMYNIQVKCEDCWKKKWRNDLSKKMKKYYKNRRQV
jgi:hypothetical protein